LSRERHAAEIRRGRGRDRTGGAQESAEQARLDLRPRGPRRHRPRDHRMAESAPSDFARAGPRMAALAGVAGDGEDDFERDGIADADGTAAAGLPPDKTGGSPADFTASLTSR